jgi:hypothetical protein
MNLKGQTSPLASPHDHPIEAVPIEASMLVKPARSGASTGALWAASLYVSLENIDR